MKAWYDYVRNFCRRIENVKFKENLPETSIKYMKSAAAFGNRSHVTTKCGVFKGTTNLIVYRYFITCPNAQLLSKSKFIEAGRDFLSLQYERCW